MANEVETLAKKDAEFQEKLVSKILRLAMDHWAKTAEGEHNATPSSEAYVRAFNQWFDLRLMATNVEDEIQEQRNRRDDLPWEDTDGTAADP